MSLTITEFRDEMGIITLDNDNKRNSLSSELIEEIISGLNYFKDNDARVAILRANKESKVFSAGHDINELAKPGRDPLSYNDPLEQVLRAIEHFPAPVIAMLNGSVWGGATELIFTCDIIIATRKATLALTPARIGVPYNPNGILHFLNMLSISVVKELFYTAQPLSAERAEQLGIINHLVAEEELETYTFALAEKIKKNAPLSIAVMKEQLRLLSKASPLSPETFERIQGLRRTVYDSNDYKEGIQAFLEKREPVFKGN